MTSPWLRGRAPEEPRTRRVFGVIMLLLAMGSGMMYAARLLAEEKSPPHAGGTRSSRKAKAPASNASYVGSAACARCHAEIANHFSQTSMGRSITPVTPEFLRSTPVSASFYDAKIDRHFETHAQDGKLYQSEFQLDAAGHEVFRNTHPVDWIIGANANGLGALIRHDDYIFEGPLSYYKSTGKWDLSPGYQKGDVGFNRVVVTGCIFCHSGRVQPVAGSDGKYQNPPFAQLAIGCENCHGPGSAHVEAMGEGESYPHGKDPTVVNPATMAPGLANDLCMGCHQTGDTRVFAPGKSFQDYRPGQPVNRIMTILMVPPTGTILRAKIMSNITTP